MQNEFKFGDITDYINLSTSVYSDRASIVKNRKTLFPRGIEYKEVNNYKYRESTSVFDSSADSLESLKNLFKRGCESVNCLVVESSSKKETIITFRGTDVTDAKDIMDDLEIASNRFFPLSVTIKQYIRKKIEQSQYKGYQVVFTGHSLGGYIAQKMVVEFIEEYKTKAIVFDAPGLETSLLHHKPHTEIYCFVTSPNYINCLNNRFGKLYFIPPILKSSDYRGAYKIITQEANSQGISGNPFSDLIIRGVVKPLSVYLISKYTGLKQEDINNYLNIVGNITNDIKKQFDIRNEKYELKNKYNHTVGSHDLNSMGQSVYENFENGNKLIKEIELKKWPKAQEFFEGELETLKKMTWLKQEESKKEKKDDIKPLTAEPDDQAELDDQKEVQPIENIRPPKPSNELIIFLNKRSTAYAVILVFIAVLFKITENLSFKNVVVGTGFVILALEVLQKSGIKMDFLNGPGLFSRFIREPKDETPVAQGFTLG